MVNSRLDYANTILYGMSKSNIDKLQRVQHALATIATNTRRRQHIRPVIQQLHWFIKHIL